MKRGIPTLFWLLAALPTIVIGHVNLAHSEATATATADCGVKLGDYRALNFARKLKIGAAEFVNPSLFDTAAVVYRYDFSALNRKIEPADLISYLNDGQVALAAASNGEFKVMSFDSKETAAYIASLKDNKLASTDITKNFTFVATLPKIGDVSATEQLVSWSATKPVVMAEGHCPGAGEAD